VQKGSPRWYVITVVMNLLLVFAKETIKNFVKSDSIIITTEPKIMQLISSSVGAWAPRHVTFIPPKSMCMLESAFTSSMKGNYRKGITSNDGK